MTFKANRFFSHFKGRSIVLLIISSILLGCSSSSLKDNQEKIKIDSYLSKIALDWSGVYKALLPCASCPGISTTIKLNNDNTFEKTEIYLETKNQKFIEKGKFTFSKDGNKIILHYLDGSKDIYALGENKLIMLDKDEKVSSSVLRKNYELRKVLK